MAKITITIEDNEYQYGRVIIKVGGIRNMLKNNKLTPAQMVALTAVDLMNELHETANAAGVTLQQYLVNGLYKHIFEDKAVRHE